MAKTTIELNLSTAFGIILLIIGLAILCIITATAYQIGTGAIQPLQLNRTMGTITISADNAVFFGIVVQVGMFALLIVASFVFMRSGLTLLLKQQKEKA